MPASSAVRDAFLRLQHGESVLTVLDAPTPGLVGALVENGSAAEALCARMRQMMVVHGARMRLACTGREREKLRVLVAAWKKRTPAPNDKEQPDDCMYLVNQGLRLCHDSAVIGSRGERKASGHRMLNVAESSTQLVAAHTRMTLAQSRVVISETVSRHVYRVRFFGADHRPHMVLMGIYRHIVFDSADVVTQAVDVKFGRQSVTFWLQRGSVYLPGYPGFEPIACSCKDWQYRVKTDALLGCKHIIAVRTRRAVHGAGGLTREQLKSERLQRAIAPRQPRHQAPTA